MKIDAAIETDSSQQQHASTNGSLAVLYPDLIALAANRHRRRSTIDRHRRIDMQTSRYASAIVDSYLDDLPNYAASSLTSLQFWHTNTIKCTHLADIAIALLTVPASTATIDRIFSLVDDDEQQQQQQLYDLIKDEQLERHTMLRFNRQFIPKS